MVMDMGTIAAAQESLRAAFQAVKDAASAAVDAKIKQRLIDVQATVLQAQGQLADAQNERLKLLEQVTELQSRLRAEEAARDRLGDYELHPIEDGKFLYRYKDEKEGSVPHYACPTCHNAGKVSVLQALKTGANQKLYKCTTCQFAMYVGPADPRKPPRAVSRVQMRDW